MALAREQGQGTCQGKRIWLWAGQKDNALARTGKYDTPWKNCLALARTGGNAVMALDRALGDGTFQDRRKCHFSGRYHKFDYCKFGERC